MNKMSDSFYIGYLGKTDKRTARWIAGTAAVMLVLFLGFAAHWTQSLADASDGIYEFGTTRSWSGTVRLSPYPTLLVRQPTGELSEMLLVAPFKFGANELTSAYDGMSVDVEGTLVSRRGITMIELVPESIVLTSASPIKERPSGGGGTQLSLEGIIVDSKCWLGVMNPGEGTVHRACARLCIRGGIPPLFVYATPEGTNAYALLHGPLYSRLAGNILPLVARSVKLSGRLTPSGDGMLARFEIDRLP